MIMNFIHWAFPFTLEELYKAAFLFLLFHRGGKALLFMRKKMDTERARIIMQHKKDGHESRLKFCLEDNCQYLTQLA